MELTQVEGRYARFGILQASHAKAYPGENIVEKLADIMGDQLNIYNCVQLLVATLVRAYHLGNERTLKRQFDLQVLSELPLCWCIGQKAGLANL